MSFFIVSGLYIALIVGTSYFTSRRESREDFLIGERKLGAFPLAISLSTSWISGGGMVFVIFLIINDFPTLLFLQLGSIFSLLVLSVFIKKTYALAKKNNWITMTEIVRGTIGAKSGGFVLIFVLILFSLWFLFELIGSGLILSSITPLSYHQAIILMGAVICIYLCLGGFKSLVRTDLLQYVLVIFMLIACFYLAKESQPIDLKLYVIGKPSLSVHGFMAGFFGFFVIMFSQSDIWQRVLAAKSAKDAQKALLFSGVFYVFGYGTIIVLLMMALTLAPDFQDTKLLSFIAYDILPSWLAPFFLISILSMMMSTLDTVLFITAQCFSTDSAFLRGKTLKKPRFFMRVSMVILIFLTSTLSLLIQDIESVFWFLLALWSSLTPICYMFLPVKKPSDNAVFISMVVLTLTIGGLYLTGHYQDHYIAYVFFAGLAMPPLFDRLKQIS